MYHPTTRVLTVLELLQAHPTLSGAELAERLEVDRRTVRRYITMLQDLGIPVEATRGPYGGYQLRPGFKLPPLMLSDDEALAITLSLMAARRHGLPADAATVAGALAKIERVLPERVRTQVQAVQAVVTFNETTAAPQPQGDTVMRLSIATQQSQRLHLRYRSQEQETERLFDPYGLVTHWERWYAVGWCHLREAIRVFRLDRMLDVELTTETFTRPPEFDSLRHVLDTLAATPWGWSVEVLLEMSLEDAQRRIPPGVALLEPSSHGVVLRAHVDQLDWLAATLMTLERPFIVRRPAELCEALRRLATNAVAAAERAQESGTEN
jgi:predicted DNA-binding transcriptional regulator YafY